MQRAYVDGDTTWYADYDEKKRTLNLYGVKDLGYIFKANAEARKDPNNGFSKSREGALARKVASVDMDVYRSWQIEFEKMGGKKQDKWVEDWNKFYDKKLRENPCFYTVDALRHFGPSDGHIIVK